MRPLDGAENVERFDLVELQAEWDAETHPMQRLAPVIPSIERFVLTVLLGTAAVLGMVVAGAQLIRVCAP